MSSIVKGVWPVPIHERWGPPVISDGFGLKKRQGRGHLGIDVMYKRPNKGLFDYPEFAPWFAMPNETPALCCVEGEVWKVEMQPQGMVVRIDHGFPWLTVYRHLSKSLVVEGDKVRPGAPVGIISHDPRNDKGLNHLHFEIWDTSIGTVNNRRTRSIDPAPIMENWEKVSLEGQTLRGPFNTHSEDPEQLVADAASIGLEIALKV